MYKKGIWTFVLVLFPCIVFGQHLGIDDLPDAAPLDCNGNLYLFQSAGSGFDTDFNRVDPSGTLTTWGNAASGLGDITQINAIGFNVEDGLIYGYAPDQTYGNNVFAVDANGTTYNLGDPTGITGIVFSGDVDAMGNLYLISGDDLFIIDLDVFPLAAIQVPLDKSGTGGSLPPNGDFAIGPDNVIYGHDASTNQLWSIDLNQSPSPTAYETIVTSPPIGSPGTGDLGAFGGLYFDSFGNLYGYHNRRTNGNPSGIYFFDIATGTTSLVQSGPRASRNDGASCAYSVGFQKTVSPSIARPGETVTYTFGISNLDVNGSPFTGIEISDILSTTHGGEFTGSVLIAGVPHPAGDFTISSANGGTNNAIEVRDITVPPGGITYIDVEVIIPDDAEFCSVLENSATLQDDLNQIPEGSSWPPGSIGPGPTELAIVKPPTLQKDVSQDSFELTDLPATITYTFTIENPNPDILDGIDFSDLVPVGTIVNASLSDSLNGTVNAYGGGTNLSILGASLPIGSTTITVDVLIPDDASLQGTHCNQANISDNVLSVFEILSTDAADPIGTETETCIDILGALPVELVAFKGLVENNRHRLDWTTSSESQLSGFEIQGRSANESQFSEIAFVEAKGGPGQKTDYSWTGDENLTLTTYRLKIYDYDGSFEYSSELELSASTSHFLQMVEIYPQPATDFVQIGFSTDEDSIVDLELYDLQGRLMLKPFSGVVKQEGRNSLRMDLSNLSAGTYVYRIEAQAISSRGKFEQGNGRLVVIR